LGRRFRTAIAAVAICAVSSNALAAAAPCARPQELEALKAAAVQQELMVAALSCEATPRYNQFVTTFQAALQASDRALQTLFNRTVGRGGTAAYHAFKTRMANAASRRSITHITNFCTGAEQIFSTALDSGTHTLATFLETQPVFEEANQYAVCENLPVLVQEDAAPPDFLLVPRLKPLQVVAPAALLTLRPALGFTPASY